MKIINVKDFNSEYVAGLSLLAKTFTEESNYNLTYSVDNSLKYINSVIEDDNQDLILAIDGENKVAGGAIVAKVTEWHVESMGYLVKLYVSPKHRRTKAVTKLLDAVCRWFDERNCVHCFSTSTANIGRNKAFEAIMGKHGFYPAGPKLIRGL